MGKAAPLFEVIYQTVQDSNNELNVDILCDIAGVSRSGYYAWVKAKPDRKGVRKSTGLISSLY